MRRRPRVTKPTAEIIHAPVSDQLPKATPMRIP